MAQLIATDNQIAVIGLGKSGFSVARFLVAKGVSFDVFDSRAEPAGKAAFCQQYPDIAVYCGELSADKLSTYPRLVVSPGIALDEPALVEAATKGCALIGDISLFCQYVDAPVVAITGSNAKSTVTTWLGDMAERDNKRVAIGGNLGTPALDLLLDWPDAELYVLELSSFQLERTEVLAADVATILNVSEDHLDRYSGMLAYQQSKQRVYRRAKWAVYNRGDRLTTPLVSQTMKTVSFGLSKPDLNDFGLVAFEGREYIAKGLNRLLSTDQIRLKGGHNIENAMATMALADCAGIALPAMIDSLQHFNGLRHRCQLIADHNGIRYYNDSKGTNVGATIAAINGLTEDGRREIILIAGGVGKGADFIDLAALIDQKVKSVVLIGESGPKIAALLADEIQCENADSMIAAVTKAQAMAQPGDKILLSPACASFDMFNSFEHRGDVFEASVLDLIGAADGII